MPASIWFLHPSRGHPQGPASTLVMVDLSTWAARCELTRTPAAARIMLRRVNECVRADHIRVRTQVTAGDATQRLHSINVEHRNGAALNRRVEPTAPNPDLVLVTHSPASDEDQPEAVRYLRSL